MRVYVHCRPVVTNTGFQIGFRKPNARPGHAFEATAELHVGPVEGVCVARNRREAAAENAQVFKAGPPA